MKTLLHLGSALVLMNILFQTNFCAAQTYANSESHGSSMTCIACVVINSGNAVDGDESTYSTLSLTVATEGAYVYQRLQFPSAASAEEYLIVEVEGPGVATLDASALAYLEITTYNGGVSNGDTKNSNQFTIEQVGSSSQYIVKTQPSSAFDEVEMKMVAGSIGAATQLRIYFSAFSTTSLPVELIYFKGAYNNSVNILEWSTAAEIHNDYFTVEKSADGINFKELQKIKGVGNSNSILTYHFNDEHPWAGKNYYRLKQTDFNDQFQYSSIIVIDSKDLSINQIAFGPNPMGDFLNLFFSLEDNSLVEIKIISMEGYSIYNRKVESTKGLNTLTINDLGYLSPGMYNVYLISNDDKVCRRIIKI